MKTPIPLGRKMEKLDMPEPPSGKGVKSPKKKSKPEIHYPSLYLEWDDKYDLPESGTMTVKFVRRAENTRKDKGGKTHQTVELDITSIEDVSKGAAEKEEKEEKSSSDVLDEAAKKYTEADEED